MKSSISYFIGVANKSFSLLLLTKYEVCVGQCGSVAKINLCESVANNSFLKNICVGQCGSVAKIDYGYQRTDISYPRRNL
jgi:hypothetical protein